MADKSGREMIADAKGRVREATVGDVLAMQARGTPAVYLDVREAEEWEAGHLPHAVLIPRGVLETHVEQSVPRDATVVVYCARGNRSALAADTLQQMGYRDVVSMAGGIGAWIESGGAIEH
jgi:rhodanese-related sulfurtransferase